MDVINSFIDFVFSIDLREIIYAAVGAFLGFWLAIIMEKKSARKNEIETIKASLKNILMELREIEDAIKNTDNTKQLIIDIPIYEAFVQSGNILAFVDKFYYAMLLKTYSSIKLLISIETNNSVDGNEELQSLRDEVRNNINYILQIIENEL